MAKPVAKKLTKHGAAKACRQRAVKEKPAVTISAECSGLRDARAKG